MPSKRGFGKSLQGVNQILQLLLQDRLYSKRQLASDERQAKMYEANDTRDTQRKAIESLMSGEATRDQVSGFFDEGENLERYQPTNAKRVVTAMEPIMTADNASEIGGDTLAVNRQVRDLLAGGNVDTSLGLMNPDGTVQPGGADVGQYMLQAMAKRRDLEAQEPVTAVPYVGRSGPEPQTFTRYMTPRQLAETPNRGFSTGLTGSEAGMDAARQASAEVQGRNQLGVPLAEGDGNFRRWLANEGNPERQSTEARGAGLTAGATEDARMDPSRVSARVNESAQTAGSQEQARFDVQNKPENMLAEYNRMAGIAAKKLSLDQQADYAVRVQEATETAANVMPRVNQVIELQMSLANGRFGGGIGAGFEMLGANPDADEMNKILDGITRPLAVLNGIRESNVSREEQDMVRNAIGISQLNTPEEARRAARNLRNLATLGPEVMSRLPVTASLGERIKLSLQLGEERRAVEERAIAAGASAFRDPITQSLMPVVR